MLGQPRERTEHANAGSEEGRAAAQECIHASRNALLPPAVARMRREADNVRRAPVGGPISPAAPPGGWTIEDLARALGRNVEVKADLDMCTKMHQLAMADPAFFKDFLELAGNCNEAVVDTMPVAQATLNCNVAVFVLGGVQQAKYTLMYLIKYFGKDRVALSCIVSEVANAYAKMTAHPSRAADAAEHPDRRRGMHMMEILLNRMGAIQQLSAPQSVSLMLNHKSSHSSVKPGYCFIQDALDHVRARIAETTLVVVMPDEVDHRGADMFDEIRDGYEPPEAAAAAAAAAAAGAVRLGRMGEPMLDPARSVPYSSARLYPIVNADGVEVMAPVTQWDHITNRLPCAAELRLLERADPERHAATLQLRDICLYEWASGVRLARKKNPARMMVMRTTWRGGPTMAVSPCPLRLGCRRHTKRNCSVC